MKKLLATIKTLKSRLSNWLLPIHWNLKEGQEVEVAFILDGVQYFQFINDTNMPYERAMAASDIYLEFENRVDRTYLKALFASCLELLNKGKLIEAASSIMKAQERLNHITYIDGLYRLASVKYFDKNENVYKYDYEYNEKKIEAWKKHNIESFFLRIPIKDLMPSFDILQENLARIGELEVEVLLNHLKSFSRNLSENEKNKGLISTLTLQIQKLESQLNTLKNQVSNNLS
jgi:hypothetical protein